MRWRCRDRRAPACHESDVGPQSSFFALSLWLETEFFEWVLLGTWNVAEIDLVHISFSERREYVESSLPVHWYVSDDDVVGHISENWSHLAFDSRLQVFTILTAHYVNEFPIQFEFVTTGTSSVRGWNLVRMPLPTNEPNFWVAGKLSTVVKYGACLDYG